MRRVVARQQGVQIGLDHLGHELGGQPQLHADADVLVRMIRVGDQGELARVGREEGLGLRRVEQEVLHRAGRRLQVQEGVGAGVERRVLGQVGAQPVLGTDEVAAPGVEQQALVEHRVPGDAGVGVGVLAGHHQVGQGPRRRAHRIGAGLAGAGGGQVRPRDQPIGPGVDRLGLSTGPDQGEEFGAAQRVAARGRRGIGVGIIGRGIDQQPAQAAGVRQADLHIIVGQDVDRGPAADRRRAAGRAAGLDVGLVDLVAAAERDAEIVRVGLVGEGEEAVGDAAADAQGPAGAHGEHAGLAVELAAHPVGHVGEA